MRFPFAGFPLVAALVVSVGGCDSGDTTAAPVSTACEEPPPVEKDAFCETCVVSPTAQPSMCTAPRIVNACCTWVSPPTTAVARGIGVRRFASTDATVQLACLDDPGTVGTSSTVELNGFVRIFSSGDDSTDVRVEIFREGSGGALGDLVGAAVTTSTDPNAPMTREDLLIRCPDGGCTYRSYKYPGVPTETPLIVRTSSGSPTAQWAPHYEYGVFISNSSVSAEGTATFEPTAVAMADLGVLAAAGGGFATRQEKGTLIGEVHDCADVRLSGATVDIDAARESDMLYLDNETNPLPDRSRSATGNVGGFGAINVTAGVPIRVSAVGNQGGAIVLLGTYVVQTFQSSMTSVTLRGRRPWQQ